MMSLNLLLAVLRLAVLFLKFRFYDFWFCNYYIVQKPDKYKLSTIVTFSIMLNSNKILVNGI
jgi:hypothetical protein